MTRPARLDEQTRTHARRFLTLLGIGAALTTLGNLLRVVDDNLTDLGE